MSQPTPFDFMDFKSLLDEDERQIQQLVGRWVDERVAPIIADAFDEHRFPAELVPEMAEMGLLGCNLEGYECAGLNNVSYGLICQELERGDSGLRSFVSVQGSLCMFPIHAWGSEEQKQRYLPKMAKGELIGCFGLTEPDGGSDPGTMKTHAKRDGDDWILNGAKMWITNGGIADVAIVWAMTDDGVRGFLVDKGMKGYTTRDTLKKYSLRASITSELFFDDVRVPESNRLPEAMGLKAPLTCLTQARYGIAWGAIGPAIGSMAEALDFAKSRVLFGRPLTHTQTIQRRFAEMTRRITTAQLLVLQLGRIKDRGELHPTQVSLAKWNNVRMGLDICREARDILGAGGISIEYSPIRHMMNLESVITYEGTETIHELSVGRQVCDGVNAF
ncbi:MAG: acyl-CoA dehydrogenase family protein [Candidatus Eisenbacteria bacterium]|uniref:Acyl-CoA dehydrogenase family protein n=1 Tax=Eiseniibacteriota bacterium TaxID=2212470 RepID=A0A956SF30_UNCEI|nr:acyl-CoA dehydrogenase family protein [Candidatus Eisenbacteria bacterium]MCB9465656.1 acyl-CoA dehydrogenase family protein [Candidatus Eisenbacteria bacterium]